MTEPTRQDGQWPPQERQPGSPEGPPERGLFGPPPGAFGPPPPPPPQAPHVPPQGFPYGPPASEPAAGGPAQRLHPSGRRGRFLLFGSVGALVLALVAGVLLWNNTSGSRQPAAAKQNLEPFQQALAELAAAPGLQYKDSSSAGLSKRDITVTASGSRYGTTGYGSGLDRAILHVGGKTFTRRQDSPGATDSNKWAAGDGSSGSADDVVKRTPSPAVLAMLLSGLLGDMADAPSPGASVQRPATVNGTAALAADTPAGRLLITAQKPYRVLRLEPYGPSRSTGGSTAGTRPLSAAMRPMAARDSREDPSQTPTVTEGPLAGSDSQGMDLTPVTGDAVEPMFSNLEKQTKELSDATDSGISLALNGSGTVKCSSGGCTANSGFVGQITTSAKSRLTGGQVTAVMTASFSIDGRSAGRCTSSPSSFAVAGATVSGDLSCSDPGAGPVFASVEAQKKADAQARSRANGGRPVQYRIPYNAQWLITARALATVEVQKLVNGVKRERDNTGCSKASGFRPSASLSTGGFHAYHAQAGKASILAQDGDDDPHSFSNLIPEDKPDWFKPIPPKTALERSGNYLYVVLENGDLVIGKRTAGHINLARGNPVLAAGEFKTKGGQVVYLDNKSGHYRPYGARAQKAAVDAFNRNGLNADGKYNAAWGKPGC
ncbi:hypothetical protein [Streptomyces sp. 769]|uniref:hypothetical protein n=1 Tax=Streptomyces sp. 769 TaxID=1262452 RepID=UPI000581F4C3|nr:hypothetical protein [Streptomyces sp. 769]AJC60612.1 YD repeat protein [Streptomyces sp. 769]